MGFKRIIYTVLIWVQSGLSAVGVSYTCCWFCGISKLLVSLNLLMVPFNPVKNNLKLVKTS